jgi:NAD/NADP transhydrogenase alpha subunit
VDDLVAKMKPGAVLVDVKAQADTKAFADRGIGVWRL